MVLLKKRLSLFTALLLFWFALSGSYDLRQLISGIFAALFTIFLYEWLLSHAKIKPLKPMPRVHWFKLFRLMAVSIVSSAWHHIFRVISGNEDTIFVQIVLDYDHPYVTMIIANVITLTPGAVSVEVDKDILKILCYAPNSEVEHQQIYKLIDDLQSVFRR